MRLECQRRQFEIPRDVTYLNVAYMSPSPTAVREAGEYGIRRKSAPWNIEWSDFFDECDAARAAVARLISANANDIAITPSASFGVSVAAKNLPLSKGGRIIVLENQHPSNYYAWRSLAAAAEGKLVAVKKPEDWDWTQAVIGAIDDRTEIIAVPNCHWMDGTMLDLERIHNRRRQVGAALVLDLTQSLGALPFTVKTIDPDFVVCASYKWLLGPYSLAYLYAAPRRQTGSPLEETPYVRANARESRNWGPSQSPYADNYVPGAHRYDVGERANFALLPMSIAALNLLAKWRPTRISEYVKILVAHAATRAQQAQFSTPPSGVRAPHMLGIDLLDRLETPKLRARLLQKKIYVSFRGGKIRISPHIFNTIADIDSLFDLLQ